MSKLLWIAIVALVLGGCRSANGRSLPYDAWRLGFFAPDYMEVWIETADVVDIDEHLFRRAGSGTVSIGYPTAFSKGIPEKFKGNPKGWSDSPSWGAGKYVMGADLPQTLYIRWQSLVEPQTYEVTIEIPEATRAIMRQGEKTFCKADGKWITGYRKAIVVGLAPGGIARVWVTGPCLTPLEVTRVQAEVDPVGPYDGKSGGEYYFLSDESKAYVEKFGVPYDSW